MQQERTSAWRSVAALAVGTLAAVACSRGPTTPVAEPDMLVLEVGGEQASLRASLLALGRPVVDPVKLTPRSAADSPASEVGGQPRLRNLLDPPSKDSARETPPESTPGGESRSDQPDAPAKVEPPLEDEWVTVPLPEGETLIHVARRHLGDGRRFAELLRWNGWSEAEARRLPVGQAIRLKRAELQ